MTKAELLAILAAPSHLATEEEIAKQQSYGRWDSVKPGAKIVDYDPEAHHGECDEALLSYINDPEITEAFNAGTKWYA